MSTVHTRATRGKFLALLASFAMIAAGLLGVVVAPAASANGNPNSPGQSGEHKITICHRTNSTTNPYVSITVDKDAADGDLGNDKGQGDHYMEHTGPVWNASMRNGGDWGDIIPPIAGSHSGRNWDAAGQAIYNNGCKVPTFTASKTSGGTADYCLNGVDGSYSYFGSGKATSNVSQADADAKAQTIADDAAAADKTAKLPTGASEGSCTVYTSTKTAGGTAPYCAFDEVLDEDVTGSYAYSGTGTSSSTISQADADTKAQALADADAAADRLAKLPSGATPGACGETPTFTSTKTQGGVAEYCLNGSSGSYAYFGSATATSTVSQGDADRLAQLAADEAADADKAAKLPGGATLDACTVFTGTKSSGGTVAYCLDGSNGSFDYSGEASATSTISQDDADGKAQLAADAEASADRIAKFPAGAIEGACVPRTPETPENPRTPEVPQTPESPITATVVEPAVVEAPVAEAPIVVSAPEAATVAETPATVAVPAAATLPAAVPAGDGSSAPAVPLWALALIALGVLGAVAAAGRSLRGNA